MNSALKTILWILVAIVIIAAGYYWYESRQPVASAPQSQSSTTSTSQATTTTTGPSLPSGSDTSDAALTEDLSGVDSQMSQMNGDTTAINQGLSDTPVSQQ